MIGIVIVSHSAKAAEGIKELAGQMAKAGQKIVAAGGTADGEIGTDALKIKDAIIAADTGEGVVVLVDLGSAILSTETALELLAEEVRSRVRIADAPILEGCVSAVVEASLGSSISNVVAVAEGARKIRKMFA